MTSTNIGRVTGPGRPAERAGGGATSGGGKLGLKQESRGHGCPRSNDSTGGDDERLSAKELAAGLGVSIRYVYEMRRCGFAMNGRRRFHQTASLDAAKRWVEKNDFQMVRGFGECRGGTKRGAKRKPGNLRRLPAAAEGRGSRRGERTGNNNINLNIAGKNRRVAPDSIRATVRNMKMKLNRNKKMKTDMNMNMNINITMAMVEQVSERVAKGLSLALACAMEGDPRINPESWERALAADPVLANAFLKARGKFLEEKLKKLEDTKDPKHVLWLLERRHADLFGKGAEPGGEGPEKKCSVVEGVPDDVLERAREYARGRTREDA